MKKIRIIIPILLSSLYVSAAEISKVFHTCNKQPAQSIELGSLVLYTDQDIKVQESKRVEGDKEIHYFVLPNTHISKEAHAMIQELASASLYSVSFDTSNVAKGTILVVTLDPKKVAIVRSVYSAIQRQNGIEVHFYNKELINELSVSRPIIETVSNTKSTSIVIDCGHGGVDNGAIGWNSLREKDINLQIGLELAQLLKKEGLSVHLARTTDATVPIDTRTNFANHIHADLFISIHSNAAQPTVSGVETYVMKPNLIREEMTSLSSLEKKIIDMHKQSKYEKSDKLAQLVHNSLLNSVSSKGTKDRSVRPAVAQVLLATTMPSILVEVGFVTNEHEAQLLSDKSYQQLVAAGITRGVLSYLGRC